MPVRNPNEGSVWKEEDGFGDLFVQYEVVLPEKVGGDMKKGESRLFREDVKQKFDTLVEDVLAPRT